MHTQPPLAPRGSPVPGVIPEPVRVVGDTLDGNAGRTPSRAVDGHSVRPAALRRRHALTSRLARLLSAIGGGRSLADARAPTPPVRAEVARPGVHDDVAAGVHPGGKAAATAGPGAGRIGSQSREG